MQHISRLDMERHPEHTDVLGDIDAWCAEYLESGLVQEDWQQARAMLGIPATAPYEDMGGGDPAPQPLMLFSEGEEEDAL